MENDIELDNVPFIEKRDNVVTEDASSYKMGFGFWRPQCLQKFASIKWFMLILIFLLLMQGIVVTGLTAVLIRSIEIEFKFPKSISSAILIGSDSAALLLVVFVSFFGKNKIRWIACGAFITGVGSIVFSIPKIMFQRNVYEKKKIESTFSLCNDGLSDAILPSTCHSQENNFQYSIVLLLGQMMMGIGHTSLQTLAPVYIHENSPSQMAPIYLGFWLASLYVGQVLGRVIGVAFLGTSGKQLGPGMDDIVVNDWWRVYLYSSFIFILLGTLLLTFPKRMVRKQIENIQEKKSLSKCRTISLFGRCMNECVIMFHQRVFLLPVLAFTMDSIFHKEITELVEHVLNSKFNVPHTKTILMVSTILVLAIFGATLAGSFIIRREKAKLLGKSAAKICAILSFLLISYSFTSNLPDCRDSDLKSFISSNKSMDTCSADCACDEKVYQPICSIGQTTYFSPCFAGCKEVIKFSNKTVLFTGCSCLPAVINATKSKLYVYTKNEQNKIKEITNYARLGKCRSTCQHFYFFIAVFVIGAIFFYIIGVPHYTIILRTIPSNKQSLALGLQFLIVRSISFLPAPMLFDLFTDSSCMVWSYDKCGAKETCLEYNLSTLGNKMIWLGTSKSVIATLLYVASFWLYPKPPRSDERNLLTDDIG